MKWKKDSYLVYASSTDECHNLGCRASEADSNAFSADMMMSKSRCYAKCPIKTSDLHPGQKVTRHLCYWTKAVNIQTLVLAMQPPSTG